MYVFWASQYWSATIWYRPLLDSATTPYFLDKLVEADTKPVAVHEIPPSLDTNIGLSADAVAVMYLASLEAANWYQGPMGITFRA